MSKKRELRAVDELGKVIKFNDCLPIIEIETSKSGIWPTTYLLICLVDYKSGERKQNTFNTQQTLSQTGSPICCVFKNIFNLAKRSNGQVQRLFNELCHISRIHKILLFLMPAYIYSLFCFLIPHIHLQIYVAPNTIIYASSTHLHSAIHGFRIHFHYSFNSVIYSNCAVELSPPLHKPTPFLMSTRQYTPQYEDSVKLIIKRNVCEMLNILWVFLFTIIFKVQWILKCLFIFYIL